MSNFKIFFVFILLINYLNAFDINKYIEEKSKNIKSISTYELKNKIFNNDDFYLIDVRLPNEVKSLGTIEYSNLIEIPRGMIEFKIQNNIIDKDDEIIVFCQKGSRGILVVNTLKEMGYTNVKNLTGGFEEWNNTCGDIHQNSNIWFDNKPTLSESPMGCSENKQIKDK